LNRSKTEYLKCWFSGVEGDSGEVTVGGVAVLRVEKFKYLGSIIEKKGDIDDNINHHIRGELAKIEECLQSTDKKILVVLKGKVYRMVVRPTLSYGAECCPIKKAQV